MQAPHYPWSIRSILQGRHSIGSMLDLCEENYRLLKRLAPELESMQGRFRSSLPHSLDLYLEVREQTAYTTLVHLTHYFGEKHERIPDPDAEIRIYHDAKQVEVLDLRQSALPLNRGPDFPTLEQKWRLNMFLSKWLVFCVRHGHRFDSSRRADSDSAANNVVASC